MGINIGNDIDPDFRETAVSVGISAGVYAQCNIPAAHYASLSR